MFLFDSSYLQLCYITFLYLHFLYFIVTFPFLSFVDHFKQRIIDLLLLLFIIYELVLCNLNFGNIRFGKNCNMSLFFLFL